MFAFKFALVPCPVFCYCICSYDGCRSAKDRAERAAWVDDYESSEEKQQRELLIALRGLILLFYFRNYYIFILLCYLN